jgi:riboflavin synthase
MFTGIVTDIGELVGITGIAERELVIKTGYVVASIEVGSSIACSGVCLTVTEIGADWFGVLASKETTGRTTIAGWEVGSLINLERALRVGDELGGHFVTGHVDGTLSTKNFIDSGKSLEVQFGMEPWVRSYVARKGSIAIDGVSLTVNEVRETVFSVNVIPHTQNVTTLGSLVAGKKVNVEIDMLARYLEAALTTAKVATS